MVDLTVRASFRAAQVRRLRRAFAPACTQLRRAGPYSSQDVCIRAALHGRRGKVRRMMSSKVQRRGQGTVVAGLPDALTNGYSGARKVALRARLFGRAFKVRHGKTHQGVMQAH